MDLWKLKEMSVRMWEGLAALSRCHCRPQSDNYPRMSGAVIAALKNRGLIVMAGTFYPLRKRPRLYYKLTDFGEIAAYVYRKGLLGEAFREPLHGPHRLK